MKVKKLDEPTSDWDKMLPGLKQMFSDVAGKDNVLKYLKETLSLRQTVFNPKQTQRRSSASFQKYDLSTLTRWLQNPQSNEKNLRQASIYMYLSSMEYQRLVEYFAGLPLWQYVVLPLGLENEPQDAKFNKAYYKALRFLHNLNIPEVMRNQVLTTVFREGVYFGVMRTDKNISFLQRINPDICRIAYVSDGVCFYSVDMNQIDEVSLQYYPTEFTTMWKKAKQSGDNWQEVPPEISMCVKFDTSVIEYSLPPFAAAMSGLYKIADAKERYDVSADQKNYKLITGQVPCDSEGNPKMDYELFEKYYSHLANNIGDAGGIGLAVTPFKLDSFDFNKGGITSEIDDIARATNNFWSNAGTPPILHGASNDHAGIIKYAIKNDEAFADKVVRQIERLLNRLLKIELSTGSVQCRIEILPTTIFNIDEYIKRLESSATKGIGKLYYMAAVGQKQIDFVGVSFIENEILKLDESLRPLRSSYNSSDDAAGRPLSDDADLTPSGEQTREDDTNANR